MGKKLYVGNLPFSTTDDSLRQIFEQVGQVDSAKVITDRDTGRSKGFGFVEMTDSAAAGKAIAELDGTKLDDYAIRVSPAQARPDRSAGNSGRPRRNPNDRPQRW